MGGAGKGLFLIGHGSRDKAGVDEFWEFAEVVRRRLDSDVALGCGFIEFASPDLDTALEDLVERGVREVHAVPLVLLGAGHMKNDGPAALARARMRHPQVQFSYARALGVHPTLIDLAAERAGDALGSHLGSKGGRGLPAEGERAVVLVGRGSTDPDANSDLFKVARMLEEGRGMGSVHASFVSLTPPDVPTTLDRARLLGARLIVVVPYFLFTGILVERIYAQARAWAEAHPPVGVLLARHLGPDPGIADLVIERFQESLAGDVRMNCDACAYRVTLPGYEHKHRAPLYLDGHHSHHHSHGEVPHADRATGG